ncbi:ABC transporter substrate-binding protein [Haloechinothrix sp. LS1_15]|uniref:ABC transporter substrate-binding protein n=1 Tax=Haloechinothrix sp. LS1_15 TaxID=2652248 RepID=UPI00294504A8|nr:ABC transporter substrate-binding protein [Haloechinothrix sp. LS1_15]MDV6012512.1 ABC transporter substrate-binding protein [Haloechinothrix sp. LS1_15]
MNGARSRHLRALSAALACGMLTTACFGDGDGDGFERLDVAMAFQPVKQMSPFSDDAFLLSKLGVAEPLTRLNEDGEVEPLLATSWEQVDETAWELTLREDVTFHDGTELRAKDVAAAINYAADASPKPRALAGVDVEAEASDGHAVTISTGDEDPIMPQRLSTPELAILAPDAYADDPGTPDPAGAATGPFELAELSGSAARLEAYPDYWDGRPQAAGVDVSFVEDAASRVGGLRTGEIDIADAIPIAQADTLDDGQLLEIPIPRTVGMLLNNTSDVFDDPALRATAAAAVDSDPVVAGVYEGRADPIDGLFGPVSDWIEDRPTVEPESEPADVDGESITLATYDDRPELPEVASVVAEDLRAAGFDVDVVVRSFAAMESDLMEGAFDAVIGTRSYLIETNDPVGYLASDWSCEGSYNLALFCEDRIDDAIANAADQTDVDDRTQAAVEIEAEILATNSFVPLAGEHARIGVANDVTGVAEDPVERVIVTAETHVP